MVSGSIDGVYRIESFSFGTAEGGPILRFKLGEYINFGEKWTNIYKVKMQPGEVISMEMSLKLYDQQI